MKKFYDYKLNKQLVSILLVGAMLLSDLPLPSYAAEMETTELSTEYSADSETVEMTAVPEETVQTIPPEEPTETTSVEETAASEAPSETASTEAAEETSASEATEETTVTEETVVPEETEEAEATEETEATEGTEGTEETEATEATEETEATEATEETEATEATEATEETEETEATEATEETEGTEGTEATEETEETPDSAILVFEEGRTTFTGAQFQAWAEQNGISFDECITTDNAVIMQNALIILSHTEPTYYQNAVIRVPGSMDLTGTVLMEDEAQTPLTYCGLGSDAAPFQGSIACLDGSAMSVTLYNSLFNVLSTAAVPTALTLCGSTGAAPIFARAVVGSGAAYWDITLAPSGSIGGVIGVLDGAFVYNSLNLSGEIAISNDGDAGLFVNTMERGARLQIPAMTIGSPAVSIHGVNAGGLVGRATNAFTGIGAAATNAVISGLTISLTDGLTVNGSSCGSLFGYLTTTPAALGLDLTQVCVDASEATDAAIAVAEGMETEAVEVAETAEVVEAAMPITLEEQLTSAARAAFAAILSGSYPGTPVGTLTIADNSTTYLNLYNLDLNAPILPSVPPFILTDDMLLSGEEFAAWAESNLVSVDNSGETLTITANGEVERMLAVLSHTDPAYFQNAVILSPVNSMDLSTPVMIGENEIFFHGLGSADAPFSGQLKHTAGEMLNITLSRSLFNTLSAGAVSSPLNLSGSSAGALFAENICGSWLPEQAGWQIFAAPTGNIGGLIGTLSENASFVIDFFSVSDAAIIGSPNAGLFCNTMHSGSSLIVKDCLSTGTGISITAGDAGSAGFAVGLMENDSNLQIPALTIGSTTATIAGANAGGLVGSAVHAFIGIGAAPTNLAISGSAVTLTDGLTVTGSNSGGFFGQLIASPDALGVEQAFIEAACMEAENAVMAVAEVEDIEPVAAEAADTEPDFGVMALAEAETAEEETDDVESVVPFEQTLVLAALTTFGAVLSEDSSYPGSPVGMLTVADDLATYLSISGSELMAGFSTFSLTDDHPLTGEEFEAWARSDGSVTVSSSGDSLTISANGETSDAIEKVLTVLSHTNPAYYQNATITCLANNANLSNPITIDETDLSFQGLGSTEKPFQGQLKHVTEGVTLSITLGNSLFNALSAKAAPTLLNLSGSSEGALFAETVAGEWPEEQDGWQISAAPSGNIGSLIGSLAGNSSFVVKELTLSAAPNVSIGGLIGSLAENASLVVKGLTLSTATTIHGSPNAGLFCNTLNAGSSLTVESFASFAAITINADTGSAGFAVGLMEAGAKLQIPAVSLGTPAVSITGMDAGGLVGSVTDATIVVGAAEADANAVISGDTFTLTNGVVVTGKRKAGGLFGALTLNDSTLTSLGSGFALTGTDLGNYKDTINSIVVNGDGTNKNGTNSNTVVIGGLVGTLSTNHNFSIGPRAMYVELHAAKAAGGVIGTIESANIMVSIRGIALQYTANNIDGEAIGVGSFGGIVCDLKSGVYLNAEGCSVKTWSPWCGSNNYGGVVSNVEGGSLLRVNGFSLNTMGDHWMSGGGIAAYVRINGAVCLAGDIDLSNVVYSTAATGQLIGKQENSLIYAQSDMTFSRGRAKSAGNDQAVPDIGTYGTVIRLGGNLPDDFITIENGVAKIKSTAAWSDNGTVVELAATEQFAAYSIALQSNNVFKPEGASNAILRNITLTDDVNLSGTGIMGLMRDNSDAYYTNIFDGGNHTLTLGIGEKWGTNSGGLRADGCMLNYNNSHNRFGLFSQLGNDAVIRNVNIAGTVRVGSSNTVLEGAAAFAAKAENTVTFENITSSVHVDYLSNTPWNDANIGGLIGQTTDRNSTIKLHNVVFDGAAVVYNNQQNTGGLLGYCWRNAIVEFGDERTPGVTIKGNTTLEANAAQGSYYNTNMGGLCYQASGYWKVPKNGIVMESASFNVKTSLGLLVNQGTNLYLELTHSDSYKLGSNNSGAGITISNSPSGYDEFVYQTANGNDIFTKRAGIISIATEQNSDGTYKKLNEEGVSTYTNKTTYGQSQSAPVNKLSRYYYNLHAYRDNAYRQAHPEDVGQALLIWSVNHYASQTSYFPVADFPDSAPSNCTFWNNRIGYHVSGSTPEANTIDLRGYSYYPIDIDWGDMNSDQFTINPGVTIIFDRDNLHLDSTSTGQHYMMHGGLIRNLNAKINNADSGKPVTLSGSVAYDSTYSGALACGSLSARTHVIQNYVLKDLYLSGYQGEENSALLINRISGNNTNVSFYNIKTASTSKYQTETADSSWYAASSLVGAVGSDSAEKITLTFGDIENTNKGIALDGRTAPGNLDTTYQTHRSIFKHSLFLDTFAYNRESSGIYNFVQANEPMVTYGNEITTSQRNPNEQLYYYGTQDKTKWGIFEDFTNNFLPYVRVGENSQNKTHEIDVNLTPLLLIQGCGTYGDPYILYSASQMQMLSDYLTIPNGTNREKHWAINYPTGGNYTDVKESNEAHTKYVYNGTKWLVENGSSELDNAVLLNHLRISYYQVKPTNDNTITLPSHYSGLGTESTPFRGVILGMNGAEIILTGDTDASPLVKYAKGTVIKDLHVTVQEPVVLNAATAYGALIGTIKGGDNVIDGVTVSYSENITASQASKPVGGAIGLVEFGGVIFRGSPSILNLNIAQNLDTNYYWNPYIGRVVNGYAIAEGCNVDNGDKNYKIPRLEQSTTDKLVYSDKTFTVNSAQDLYLLSAIMNSYTADGYQTNAFARGMDPYENIGIISRPETAEADEHSVPYLMRRYATSTSSYNLGSVTVNLEADVDMREYDAAGKTGFRGLARRYHQAKYNDSITINGNDHTITMDMVANDHEASYNIEGVGLLNGFAGNVSNLTVVGSLSTCIDVPAGLVAGRLSQNGRMTKICVGTTEKTASVSNTINNWNTGSCRVGGVVGLVENNAVASTLTVTHATVSGNVVGGAIGQLRGSNATAENITVTAPMTFEGKRYRLGGAVGIIQEGTLRNTTINGLNVAGTNDGVSGGLVGIIEGTMIDTATLTDVTVTGKWAGGAVGSAMTRSTTITGFHYVNGTISGQYGGGSGGVIAETASSLPTLLLKDCIVGNPESSENTVNVGAQAYYAGGLVAAHLGNTLTIENCLVTQTTITTQSSTGGGFVGMAKRNPSTVNLRNCTLTHTNVTPDGNAAAILASDDAGSNLTLNAFNILIDNVNVKAKNNYGIIAGYSNNGIYNIVGLSVQNGSGKTNAFGRTVGQRTYVVYADHTGQTVRGSNSPAVVTNPVTQVPQMGTFYGDGAAMYDGNTTMPMHIYNTATNNNAMEQNGHRTYDVAVTEKVPIDNLTSYAGRNPQTTIQNFPLLLVDKSKSGDINELIANYLNLLTNGGWSGVKDRANVDVVTYVHNDNQMFVQSDNDTLTFTQNSGKFGGGIGSDEDGGFTLLTISIPDPTGGETPMILHVPVFVIRPVLVTFDADILSGFHFLDDRFAGDHVSTLIESDNRATLRLCYTYEYNWGELYKANPEKLNWNFSKVINNRLDNQDTLPSGTRLTLIDPQSGSVAYPITLDNASELNLAKMFSDVWQPKTIKELIPQNADELFTSIREVYYLVIEAPSNCRYSSTTFGIPDDDLATEKSFPYELTYHVNNNKDKKAAELTIYQSASLTAQRQSDSVVGKEQLGNFQAITYDDTICVTADTTVEAPDIIFGDSATRYLQFDVNMMKGEGQTTRPRSFPSGTKIDASFYTLTDDGETPIANSSVSQVLQGESALVRVNLNQNIASLRSVDSNAKMASIKVRVKLNISFPQDSNVIPSAILADGVPENYIKFDGTVSMAENPEQTVGRKTSTFSSGANSASATGFYLNVVSNATMRLDATDVFQLGINPASLDETEQGTARIDAIATIDASQVAQMPDSMTYALKLLKKADDGSTYQEVTDPQNYVSSVTIGGRNGWTVSDNFSNGQKRFTVPLSVEVNRSVRDYANYRLTLTVSFTVGSSELSYEDYIVYTYSRIPLDLNLSLLDQAAQRSKN